MLEKTRKEIAKKLSEKRSIISNVDPSKSSPLFDLKLDGNDMDEFMRMESRDSYLKSGIRKKTYESEINSARSLAKEAREEILKEEAEKLKNKVKSAATEGGKGGGSEVAPGFFKKNKKALLIGTGIAGVGGLGYLGYKKLKKE